MSPALPHPPGDPTPSGRAFLELMSPVAYKAFWVSLCPLTKQTFLHQPHHACTLLHSPGVQGMGTRPALQGGLGLGGKPGGAASSLLE